MWLSVWSEVQVICIWPADATATATAIISCFIEIQNGSAFLVLAYPGCPGKFTIKWVCEWPVSVA